MIFLTTWREIIVKKGFPPSCQVRKVIGNVFRKLIKFNPYMFGAGLPADG
jgi:hypothetical protein